MRRLEQRLCRALLGHWTLAHDGSEICLICGAKR